MLWAGANFMSVHATAYLGMRIGFPLTQTCVIFAAMWGIFYFQEVSIQNPCTILQLLTGVSLVIIGSVFLALSG
jgi:glucose uptake protein GlcU